MQTNITLYPFTYCNLTANGKKTNNLTQLCAGNLNGKQDSCQGDSGNPLMYRNLTTGLWYVYGLVSYGLGCAQKNTPGIYTNLSGFKDWIESKIL